MTTEEQKITQHAKSYGFMFLSYRPPPPSSSDSDSDSSDSDSSDSGPPKKGKKVPSLATE